MYPGKLVPGDEVRIIAPSCSLKIVSQVNINYAITAIEKLGIMESFNHICGIGRHYPSKYRKLLAGS